MEADEELLSIFWFFFFIKNLDPDLDQDSSKCLYPDPDSVTTGVDTKRCDRYRSEKGSKGRKVGRVPSKLRQKSCNVQL